MVGTRFFDGSGHIDLLQGGVTADFVRTAPMEGDGPVIAYALVKDRQQARWRVRSRIGSNLFEAAGRAIVAVPATRDREAVWAAIDVATGRCDWVLALPGDEMRCAGLVGDKLLFVGDRHAVVVGVVRGDGIVCIDLPADVLRRDRGKPIATLVHTNPFGFLTVSRRWDDAARGYVSTVGCYRWP
jgi:hypothetical protein